MEVNKTSILEAGQVSPSSEHECSSILPPAKRAFTASDLIAMQRVGGPVSSPNGSFIVFTLKTYDPVLKKSTTCLQV